MKRRMNNIFKKDGRSFILAMDHAAMMPCMAYPGSTDNEQTLAYMAQLAAEADRYNLPVGVEALPYGFEKHEGIDTRSVENMAYACRQGVELGADFIKAEYVGGERFREVTEGCYAPILVLGGSKAKSEAEIFHNIRGALDAGAKGIIMGRNIYRHENIAKICAAIVHDDASADDALAMLK